MRVCSVFRSTNVLDGGCVVAKRVAGVDGERRERGRAPRRVCGLVEQDQLGCKMVR